MEELKKLQLLAAEEKSNEEDEFEDSFVCTGNTFSCAR